MRDAGNDTDLYFDQQVPPQLRFATTSVRLHYAEQGDRTGEAFVLLHGYSDSWFSFSRVLPCSRSPTMPLRLPSPDKLPARVWRDYVEQAVLSIEHNYVVGLLEKCAHVDFVGGAECPLPTRRTERGTSRSVVRRYRSDSRDRIGD